MPWLKLDDAMGTHRKTRRLLRAGRSGAGLASFGLHALAMLHCAEYLTDGFVETEFVDETLDDAGVRGKQRHTISDALVRGGQWEPVDGGWLVHGYLEHNPSRADVEKRRAADAARKAAGRNAQSARRPRSVQPDTDGTDDGFQWESDGPVPSRPVPHPTAEQASTPNEPRESSADVVPFAGRAG